MFGNIIEKVLKTYLGQYLDGIESKYIHVGMFSGKFKVENVRIKQELIDLLEWPIQLKFSFVETFEVNFQIKNYRSKPFRIEMSNIFMMVTPREKQDWNLKRMNSMKYKQEWIDYYIQQFIADREKQEKTKQIKQGDSGGYIERIAAVVVDNIEISIKNIHFRFESPNPVFAWGITVGCIEAFTMSKDWQQKKFIDRTNPKNKDEAINKLISIKNVGFYWENSSAEMFASSPEMTIVEKMYEYTLYQAQADNLDFRRGMDSAQYIVCLNVEVFLKMNFLIQKWDIPEFDMKISFNNIDIRIDHEQLKDMLGLNTFLGNYQYAMRIEKDKMKLRIIRPDSESFEKLKSAVDALRSDTKRVKEKMLIIRAKEEQEMMQALDLDSAGEERVEANNIGRGNRQSEALEIEIGEKEERLKFLKKELSQMTIDFWKYCTSKVIQYLMEKNYKEILKKILTSKLPNVQKLLRKRDFQKIIQNKILQNEEVLKYLKAIRKNDLEDLVRWSKIAQDMIELQKSYEKNRQLQKKKKKKGLFGLLAKSESDEEDDEPEDFIGLKKKFEKAKFQEFMDQQMTFPNRNVNIRPKEYVWMKIEISIEQGLIQISELISIEQGKHPKYHDRNNKLKQIEEGLLIQWQDITFEMLKRDHNYEMSTKLRDLQVYLFTQQQDSRNQVLVPIIKKAEQTSADKKPLVRFRFEKQPISKPNTFFILEGELQQVIITYYAQKIHRIQTWLKYEPNSEQLQEQAQENLQKFSQYIEEGAKEEEIEKVMFKKEQSLVMLAPIIVIPLSQQSSNESECLVINFQELKFQSVDEAQRQRPILNIQTNGPQQNSNSNTGIPNSPANSPQIQQLSTLKPSPHKNPLLQNSSTFGQQNILQIPSHPIQNVPSISKLPTQQETISHQQTFSKTIHPSSTTKKNGQTSVRSANKNEQLAESVYEFYKIEATGITISYFSSINHLNNHLRFKNSTKYDEIVNNPLRKKGIIHDVVEKFNFSLEMGFIKDQMFGIPSDIAKIRLKSDISNITMNITSYLYFNLRKIDELFHTEDDITKVQEFLQQDKEILLKFSQEKGYLMKRGDTFKSWANYFVIFSGNYLYFFNNKNDDYYTYHIYFKHAVLKAEFSSEIGVPYCIKLVVKGKEIYLAANNNQEYRKWMRVLTKYQSIVHQEKEKKKKPLPNALPTIREKALSGTFQFNNGPLLTWQDNSANNLQNTIGQNQIQNTSGNNTSQNKIVPNIFGINPNQSSNLHAQSIHLGNNNMQFLGNEDTTNKQQGQMNEQLNLLANEIDIKLTVGKVNIQIHQEFKKKTSLLSPYSAANRDDSIQDNSQWLDITLHSINMTFTSKPVETNLKINLGSIKAIDYVHLYPQGYIQSVAQSYPFIEDKTKKSAKNLMEFEITTKKPNHPYFNNIEMDIKAKIGSLHINWKPDTFKRVLNFFIQQNEQSKLRERKDQISHQQNKMGNSHFAKEPNNNEGFNNFPEHSETRYKQGNFGKQKNSPLFQTMGTGPTSHPKILKSKFTPIEEEEQQSYLPNIPLSLLNNEEFTLPEPKEKSMQINIHAQLEELQIILIHRTSDHKNSEGLYPFTAMARIDILKFDIHGKFYEKEMYMDAQLGDLQLIDLTQFPQTSIIYNPFSIEGMKVFGREEKEAGSMVSLSFGSYDTTGIENKFTLENIYMVVDIKVNKLYLVYFQKPFLRLVNYWTQQLLAVLTNSYESDNYEEGGGKNNSKDLLSLLKNPKFMKYRVTIDKPKIILKSTPSSSEWVELNLGSITIQNENYQKKIKELENDRKINFMWAEKIQIECKEMSVFMKCASSEIRVSDNIHFNLEIEMFPLFSTYQQYFKSKTDLINQIEILGKSSQITLKISKHQYQMMMDILSLNLDFDDGYDKYFIFNYQEISSSSNQVQTYFQIDFVEISLYLQDSYQNLDKQNEQGLISFKFHDISSQEEYQTIKLSISDAKFIYIKEVSNYFEVEFHGMDLIGSYFLHKGETFGTKNIIEDQQYGFLGTLGPIKSEEDKYAPLPRVQRNSVRKTTISMRNAVRNTSIKSPQNENSPNHSAFNPSTNDEQSTIDEYLQKVKASVRIVIYEEGSIQMKIKLANSKFLVNSFAIFSILNFLKLKNDVAPKVNSKKKKKKSLKPLSVELSTKNILIGIQPEPKEKQLIVLSGEVQVIYEENGMNNNHQRYHNEDENEDQNYDESSVQYSQSIQTPSGQSHVSPNTSIKVSANNLEVSNSLLRDIIERKIETKKRNIMPPTQCLLELQSFFCDCEEEILNISNIKFFLEKTKCHLSYKDLELIYSTLIYQNNLKNYAKLFEDSSDPFMKFPHDRLIARSISQFSRQQSDLISNQQSFNNSIVLDPKDRSKKYLFEKKTFGGKSSDPLMQLHLGNNLNKVMVQEKAISKPVHSQLNSNAKNIQMTESLASSVSSKQIDEQAQKKDILCTSIKLFVHSIEVLVINDLNQQFIPMIHLSFQLMPCISYIEQIGIGVVDGVCMLEIEYFNPSVGKMEPIIEEASFQLLYKFNKQSQEQLIDIRQNITEGVALKQIININISDRMIAVLYKSMQYWRKRFQASSTKLNPDAQQLDYNNFEGNFSMQHSMAIQPSSIFQRQISKILNNGEQNIQKESVTLFSFYNMTGYPLTVKKIQQDQKVQSVKIEVGKTLSFQVESDQENFAKTFESHYSVKVQFDTKEDISYAINEIKLDRERQDVYLWKRKKNKKEENMLGDGEDVGIKYEEIQKEELENARVIQHVFTKEYLNSYTYKNQENHFFLSQIRLDDVRKTIILSSCFVIQNLLQYRIRVKLENQKKGVTNFEIQPKEYGAIPHEFMDEKTEISLQGDSKNSNGLSEFSTPQSLLELFRLTKGQCKELVHLPMVCIISKEEDTIIKNRVVLVIDTLLTIQNQLPLPLYTKFTYSLINKERNQEIDRCRYLFDRDQYSTLHKSYLFLMPQQLYQEQFGSLTSRIELQIYINGFIPSANILLYAKGEKESVYPKEVYLKDPVGKTKQLINIERRVEGGSVNIVVYCKVCLINTTGLDLYFYKQDGRRLELIQGQTTEGAALVGGIEPQEPPKALLEIPQQKGGFGKKLIKQKSLFDALLNENDSICDPDQSDKSQITDQFFRKVILLNDKEEKISISFTKADAIRDVGIQEQDTFALLSIKNIQVEDQDYIDFKLKKQSEQGFYDLSLSLKPHQLNGSHNFTKILTLLPKYVIVNSAQCSLEISLGEDLNKSLTLSENKRVVVKWSSENNKIRVKPSNYYNWSGIIPIEQIRTYHFYCKIQNSQNKIHHHGVMFLNVSVEQMGSMFYIIIKDVQGEDIPYMIQNDCQEIKIDIQQVQLSKKLQLSTTQPKKSVPENSARDKFEVLPNQQISFSWQSPAEDNKIDAFFSVSKPDDGMRHAQIKKVINLQSIDFEDQIICEVPFRNKVLRIQQKTLFRGMTRILKFSESSGELLTKYSKDLSIRGGTLEFNDEEQSQSSQLSLSQQSKNSQAMNKQIDQIGERISIKFQIAELGISFIANHKGGNKELNYIFFSQLEASFSQNKEFRDYSLNINFCQVDNNTDSETITPITLTPKQYKLIQGNDESKMFSFKLTQNHQAQSLSIAPLQVKIDQEYLQVIENCSRNLQRIIEVLIEEEEEDEFNVKYTITKYLFESQKRRLLMEKNILKKEEFDSQTSFFEDWRFHDLPEISTSIYIKNLQIEEIQIFFSYHPSFISQPDSFHILNAFANVLGTAIGNVDDAPIKIGSFAQTAVFDTLSGIKQQIIKNYKSQAIKQLFRILGSIEIIGNPVGLFTKIGDGFQDLIEKPFQGISEGPLEFGVGIAEGTSSLLKNGVAGTFQSINKMTGTLSTGVSKITMDQEYQEKRRRFMMKQPKSIIDGFEQAGISVYRGFSDGISGIVTQPYEGAQSDGIGGFFMGTVKGLTGAIVKPITGILDATSKTAEGFSNMVTHFDDKSNDKRMRNPRVFYDFMEYFKRYSETDAMFRIFCYSIKSIRESHIIDCVNLHDNQYLGICREKVVKFKHGFIKPEALIDPHMIEEVHYSLTKSLDYSRVNAQEINIRESNQNISPNLSPRHEMYKVTISYLGHSDSFNLYGNNSDQRGVIEVFIDSEEKVEQLTQKLRTIKHKNQLMHQRSNIDNTDNNLMSPMRQESFHL